MQITFTINRENYWRCWRHLLKPSATLVAFIIPTLFRFAMVYSVCLLCNSSAQALQIAGLSTLIISVMSISTAFRSSKPQFEQSLNATPGMTGQYTLTLSSQGVRRISPLSDATFDWRSYTKIQRSRDGITFHLGPSIVQCVPADAFSSVGEGEAFYQKVCEYWEAAKSGRQMSDEESVDVWPPPPTRQG